MRWTVDLSRRKNSMRIRRCRVCLSVYLLFTAPGRASMITHWRSTHEENILEVEYLTGFMVSSFRKILHFQSMHA